ncbi:MAG TPA: hypothetical protein VGI70_21890, partial [Polyangiales bacterium]
MSAFRSRVLVCGLCCLAWSPRYVAAQAEPDAGSPDSAPAVVPLSAQGETMAPSPSPPSAATAAQPSLPPPSAAAVPAPAPPPSAAPTPARSDRLRAKGPPAVQGHDHEHPLPRPTRPDEDEGPLLMRLSLGIEASIARAYDVTSLRRPSYASFDIGYRPGGDLAIVLRLQSWLPYSPYASQFLGAGVSYRFDPEDMFLTGVIGVAMVSSVSPKFEERLQGLAGQFDLGQQWPLSAALAFAVGVHFELATPWLGVYQATDFGAGMFVALAYR